MLRSRSTDVDRQWEANAVGRGTSHRGTGEQLAAVRRRLHPRLALIVTTLALTGCATTYAPPPAVEPPAPPAPPPHTETGIASWYDAARGARGLTAAHRRLPIGTRIRVTNLENGRDAVLVVTGRGPFQRGRVLDVSRHAARRLGFLAEGTAHVRIEVLHRHHHHEPRDD